MDPNSPKNSFFDSLPPRTSFVTGFITAILCLGTVGFIILGIFALKDVNLASDKGDSGKIAINNNPTSPTNNIPADIQIAAVTDADHLRGDKNTPITIIEYSDYQCPFCERFHPTMQQLMTDYPGKIRWVFRHFPLSFHPEAEPAAEAAECASEQNKFWEYTDALFTNQANLGEDLYVKLAKDLKLDLNKFKTCRDSDRTLTIINADAQSGANAGVSGTPGSFIIDQNGNAQEVAGALPLASIKAMIDPLLQ